MHVLCAPPAFILSQDQTLLFWYLYFLHFHEVYKSYLKVFSSSFKLLLFWFKNFKKIYLFGTFFFSGKNYRFGLFSKGFYCLLFNVLFCSFMRNVLHYTIPFFVCQHFLTFFLKIFFLIYFTLKIRQNKKLVMIVFILFFLFYFYY